MHVQILLALWLVSKYLLQIPEECLSFRRGDHASHRHTIEVRPSFELAACSDRIAARLALSFEVWVWDRVLSTELLDLTVSLQEDDWTVEQDYDQQVDVDVDFHVFDRLVIAAVMGITRADQAELIDRVVDHSYHVQSEEQDEQQKVLMVLVAQAIVDESAVMVETLHALVTVITVHGVFRSQILAINTDVIQVELLVNESFDQAEEVFLKRDVAWIDQSEAVEED